MGHVAAQNKTSSGMSDQVAADLAFLLLGHGTNLLRSVSVEAVVRWFCQHPYPLGNNPQQAEALVALCLQLFSVPLGSKRSIDDVRYSDIAALYSDWRKAEMTDGQIAKLADMMCCIFEKAHARGLVGRNIAAAFFRSGEGQLGLVLTLVK